MESRLGDDITAAFHVIFCITVCAWVMTTFWPNGNVSKPNKKADLAPRDYVLFRGFISWGKKARRLRNRFYSIGQGYSAGTNYPFLH
jgi:hypothetical protein